MGPFLLLLSDVMTILNGSFHPTLVHLIALPLTAWGLERLVQTAHPQLELAGVAASVAESRQLLERLKPDVVVLDLDAEDGIGSLADLQALTGAKILVLTASRNAALHDGVVLAGARGVVQKRESPSILLKAITKVQEGELWIDRSATSRIFIELARQKAAQGQSPEKQKIAMLTSRERQTIATVASDASAPGRVFAERLHISEHTLRNHLTSIYSKLGVSNRVDLYAFAHKHGLNEAR
jgi:two-component system nitrate/nitrite response regulator NarL